MAKFHGVIGYGDSVEVRPGVWKDVIEERSYFGDVLSNARDLRDDDKVNENIVTSNSISILADPYAFAHFFNIRYIQWMGILWTVSKVQEQRPRLILRLGGKYNGPKPAAGATDTP